MTPPALPATIAAGGQLDVTVRFTAVDRQRRRPAPLTIASDDPATPIADVQLAGFWQTISEGGQEPNLQRSSRPLRLHAPLTYPGQPLNRAGRIETAGEEVLSPYWIRANTTKPVTVRQLAAFHTQGNTATFFWHQQGAPRRRAVLTHAGVDGQSVLPR